MAGEILKFIIEVDSDTANAKVARFTGGLEAAGRAGTTAAARTDAAFMQTERRLTAFAATASSLGRTFSIAMSVPIAAIGAIGIAFNAMQEQARIAFTTMLGSGTRAGQMLNQLKDFAARTPFEFPDLVRATQRMMAYGFAAQEVLPTLTAIGDAASALGGSAETIQRITTALGQIRAKGTVQAEEMRQLAEAGIPVWEILANKIGVSIPEAMKRVEARAVSATVGIAALVEGINDRFGGGMEKLATSWIGLISTIKDEARFLAGALTEGLFNALKGPLDSAKNGLHDLRVAIEALPNAAKAAFAGVAIGLALLGPGLLIVGTLAGSLNNLIRLYQVLTVTGSASAMTATGVASTATKISMLTAASGALLPIAVLVGKALLGIGAAFAILYLAKQISDFTGLTETLKGTAGEAFRLAMNLGKVAATTFRELKSWLSGIRQEITGIASELADLMPDWIRFMGASMGRSLDSPRQTMRSANEFIENVMTPPGILPATASLPPEHRRALMENELAMRAGKPREIRAGGTEPDKVFQQQVDNIVRSVIREANESRALDAALKKLADAHVPLIMIAEKLGDQIKDNAAVVEAMGGKVSAARQRVLDFVETQERLENAMEDTFGRFQHFDGVLRGQDERLQTANHHWANYQAMLAKIGDSVRARAFEIMVLNETLRESSRLRLLDPTFLPGIPTVRINEPFVTPPGRLPSGLPAEPEEWTRRRAEETARQFAEALSHAMGNVLTEMLRSIAAATNGARKFGDAITGALEAAARGFAQVLSDSIVLAMSRPLIERFQRLAERLARVFDRIGDRIGDVIGDTIGKALGTKIGKQVGDVLGEIFGVFIGAAIGAAITAIGNQIGKGRRTANEFVQGQQNPFGRELGGVVDPFWQEFGAGTLTRSEGMAAGMETLRLWEDFQRDAAEFAAKGGTEAKVAMQALATLTPIVAQVLGDMDAAIEHLGDTAAKTALEFQQAVEAMVRSVTGYADNADVLEESIRRSIEKGTPMSLVIEALGSAIEQTVHQLTALGIDVPPWIAAAAYEMERLATNTKTATQALRAGPDVQELVRMRIEAYNTGFDVGRLVRSPNAARYDFSGVPASLLPTSRPSTMVLDREAGAPEQPPTVQVVVEYHEGDFSVTQQPGQSTDEIIDAWRERFENNEQMLRSTVTRGVKAAWKAEGPTI